MSVSAPNDAAPSRAVPPSRQIFPCNARASCSPPRWSRSSCRGERRWSAPRAKPVWLSSERTLDAIFRGRSLPCCRHLVQRNHAVHTPGFVSVPRVLLQTPAGVENREGIGLMRAMAWRHKPIASATRNSNRITVSLSIVKYASFVVAQSS